MTETLPSVTRILQAVGLAPDFSHIPADTLDHARARGTALHRAIFLYHQGTLDESSIHEEIMPGFQAYLGFVKATEHEPLHSELELVHPTWQVIGHPDRVGLCHGLLTIPDWKYTAGFDKEYVRLQLAGYRWLWNANHPAEPIERCLGVHLKKNGTFALHDLTSPEAEQTFVAAVVVYRALQERNGR